MEIEWNEIGKNKTNKFNIWDFRKLKKIQQIEYIYTHKVPKTITIREKEEVYDEIFYGDYSYHYNYYEVDAWKEISRSWNLGVNFIHEFINELDVPTLLNNQHLKLSDYNKLKLYKLNGNIVEFFNNKYYDAKKICKKVDKDNFFTQQEKDYITKTCVMKKLRDSAS